MSLEHSDLVARPASDLDLKWVPLSVPELDQHINTPEENFRNFEFMQRNQESQVANATNLEDFRKRLNFVTAMFKNAKTGKSGDGSQMSEENIGYSYELGIDGLDLIAKTAKGKGILDKSDWGRINALKRHYKDQPTLVLEK